MNIIQHKTYTTYSDLHFINVLRLNNFIGKSKIFILLEKVQRESID